MPDWSVRLDTGELEERQITANPQSHTEKTRGILVAEWLVRDKIDLVIQKEQLGKGPEYAFRDAGIEVEVWDVTGLADVIDRLRTEVSRFA